ncbi:MAG: NADH-quinone oxidoreductase subunit N [Legionellales bacterium RIFCSPHIGHO2_12_FULL_42_9]|nr:MAG: NADH-quinone oxidoreductase subunit N [Legionellales bacterium RIFCSPHIGHO2_12_FULL_42_9]
MMGLLDNIHGAIPEIIILATACIVLLAGLFMNMTRATVLFAIACLGLLLSAFSSFILFGDKFELLGGLFSIDLASQLMKIFIAICVGLSFIYSRQYLTEIKILVSDYYTLGLFSTLGMMVIVSANSLLTVYLGIELLSLPLYAMIAIRRTSGMALEAAIKYFVMGSIASGMLLYGFSFIYGATGSLALIDIANAIAVNFQDQSRILTFAMIFILAGLGFKLAAIPFHMWAPDVYAGAPTPVTLFISAAPKIAAVGVLLRLLTLGFSGITEIWQPVILLMALLSAGIGNLLAVVQTNLKRLFAYSAISHIGYALFGILAANHAGYAAALYYILIYALMAAAGLGLLVLMSNHGFEVETIAQLKGLHKRSPWMAFLMMIVMFSMAGVPPTVGFFTKLLVLKALIDTNWTLVAIFGLIFAVIGAYYYIRIVKSMYFDIAEGSAIKLPVISKTTMSVYSINCLSLLYFGMFPMWLLTQCLNSF